MVVICWRSHQTEWIEENMSNAADLHAIWTNPNTSRRRWPAIVLGVVVAIVLYEISGQQSGQAISYVISLPVGYIVYLLTLRVQQKKMQVVLQSLNVEQFLSGNNAKPLFLYLRSFRMGRSTLLGRLLPWNWGW